MRRFDVFFDVNGIIAKSSFGLGTGATNGSSYFVFIFYHPHPFAAATSRSFYHHRKAYFMNHFDGLLFVGDRLCSSGNYRHAGFYHSLAGHYFVAHARNRVAIGANKNDALGGTTIGKSSIFRKETIARMNSIGTGAPGYINYFFDVEVTFTRRGCADVIRFVGIAHMHRSTIGIRKYRHRLYPHLTARAHHTNGYLATIGNQYFFYHKIFLNYYRAD